MNILLFILFMIFCSPQKPLGRFDQIAYGVSYLSAMLKKNGHTTQLLIAGSSLDDIPRRLLDETIIPPARAYLLYRCGTANIFLWRPWRGI